ncbi:MAG: transglutaminase family protein [Actinomycetota bacterium]
MTIQVALNHTTTYEFDRTVGLGPHVIRLRPAPHTRTPISAYSLRVDPADHFLNWQQDPFGNFEARLVFPERADRLEVTVDVVADLAAINPFDFFLDDETENVPFDYDESLATDLAPYLAAPEPGPRLAAWLEKIDRTPKRTIDHLVAINARLATDIAYTVRMEPGVQTPEETLTRAVGSCRDTAWLLVHILRAEGLAARFVSGYLVQLVADVTPLDGPAGPTDDFTDLHAWTEVFLPGAGWVGLDPTSGLFAAEGHIPLAATPSPSTAAPISGLVDECEVEFSFSNTVRRIHEDPRVTKPYDESQWAAINTLGRSVDDRLRDGDVRLTMGGEPTFVSIHDMASPEWNTVADGPDKRYRAGALMRRLQDRFAPGGLVHHGQGKWYPGEPLPRWQQALVWRADEVPLWRRRELLADPGGDATIGGDPSGADAAGAVRGERFVNALASALGLDGSTIAPAWEDPLHQVWQEASLPAGSPPPDDIDPLDPLYATERGRRALVGAIDARYGRPTGWVLPLFRAYGGDTGTGPDGAAGRWASAEWSTRRDRLFLLPGDSPLGYRLPIPSLSWSEPPPVFEPSPFARLRPLPGGPGPTGGGRPLRPLTADEAARLAATTTGFPGSGPAAGTTGTADTAGSPNPAGAVSVADGGPPTALCVEIRNGHLHVFLPPLESAEHLVELAAAIESTADDLGVPVVVEGYPAPSDPRLRQLVVAPDPGVIEVNVPPSSGWEELVWVTDGIYDDARHVGLGTETFDLDGTHSGTGGGNHVTIGGATSADSPLLRRPSLLRSLLTYWQHHPALSYVFSGRFIGPSSQAPRVDEGRDDQLYELETAFAEIDRLGDDGPPWMVDRLLRHLLTDQTGNTHRAEFCIDKMFSPEGERGRMGLLELRAFEMPPHPEMALVQALLVRSLVARCWDAPYHHDPVRWGTALHDRFLLPWHLERDLHDVTADLGAHGIDFDPAWFDPFMEFRFPRHGTTTVGGVTMELRGAIEPWHVLGEEATGAGMARYVDSSVERLQLTVDGAVEGRHVVTCNGVEVPLHPTDVNGTSVAGIRFKAWNPPSGLHPSIGIDSPLTFDLHDRWSGRSLGGCRYHVVHPGGLAFESPPVNAAVAESRRRTRFEAAGHTPGESRPDDLRPVDHREFPHTLDLRRAAKRGH